MSIVGCRVAIERRMTERAAGALLVLTCCLLFGATGRSGWACDSTVRGQAFVDPRDLHRLCVIHDGSTTSGEAIASRLAQWLDGPGASMNVELLQLDAGEAAVQWEEYGLPSAPPNLPVVMLAGYERVNRRSFVITHWAPAPDDADLEALRTSPVREALKREVTGHWAVLLHAPAVAREGDEQPTSVPQALDAVARNWREKFPPGVAVVRLDRTDPRERLLVAFLGIQPTGPEWVGVVFGRGKVMGPPLEGDAITEGALDQLLARLVEVCSCLRPPSMMGVDLPMTWEPAIEQAVVSLVVATDASAATAENAAPVVPSAGRRVLVMTGWVLGVAAVLVLAAAAVVWRRDRARAWSRRSGMGC